MNHILNLLPGGLYNTFQHMKVSNHHFFVMQKFLFFICCIPLSFWVCWSHAETKTSDDHGPGVKEFCGMDDIVYYVTISDMSLGKGANGSVFEGETKDSCSTQRKVAVKILHNTGIMEEEFFVAWRKIEGNFRKAQTHANIVECIGFGNHENSKFIVMEYMQMNLENFVLEHWSQLKYRDIVKIVFDIAKGLKHLHNCNVVCCNLKPNNIFVQKEQDEYIAKIGDIGMLEPDAATMVTFGTSRSWNACHMRLSQLLKSKADWLEDELLPKRNKEKRSDPMMNT